jgi:ATP-dependent Lon protease
MLPARNKKDYDDIPASAREHLDFVWLEDVDQALGAVFECPADAPV